jgi:hypothetical protein
MSYSSNPLDGWSKLRTSRPQSPTSLLRWGSLGVRFVSNLASSKLMLVCDEFYPRSASDLYGQISAESYPGHQ